MFSAGELHPVVERLTQAFFAFEGEDVECCIEAADTEFVEAVIEENGQYVVQIQTSLVWIGVRGGLVSTLVQALDSFQEADKC
jgi:hypothetical protein